MATEEDDGDIIVAQCSYYSISSFNDYVSHCGGNFFMIHLNVRSFRRNFDEFVIYLNNLDCKFQVIVLTETWFSKDFVGHVSGYSAFHSYRNNRGGGGVSIFVSDTLTSHPIDNLQINCDHLESVSVRVRHGNDTIYVMGIYRPPDDAGIDAYIEKCQDLFSSFGLFNKRVYILGDFNINMLDFDNRRRKFSDLMSSQFLLPLIDLPTRVTENSETLLDNVWTNDLSIVDSGVFQADITDHFPIFVSFTLGTPKETFIKYFRDHSDISLAKLTDTLQCFALEFDSVEFHCINGKVNYFLSQFFSIYNDCCPVRSKCVTVKSITKPWINSHLRSLIGKKHKLFNRYKAGSCSFHDYNSFKNSVTRELKKTKRKYYFNKFNSVGDSRGVWKILKKLLNKSKPKGSELALKIGNEMVTNAVDVSREFNEYFSSVADTISQSIPVTNVDPLSYMRSTSFHESFFIHPSSSEEVVGVIGFLKRKGSRLDEISSFIYKHLSHIIAPLISHLFNESVASGLFPDALKQARVVPVFKKGDRTQACNYRPISTISVLSKIFEYLILSRLQKFLNTNSILNACQFGFRPNLSTSDAVCEFLGNAYDSIDDKNFTVCVFLDFAKAFDTVNHQILLNKLYKYGIRGLSNDWFRSYLFDRRQCVSVDSGKSEFATVNCGVPQGSILGPMLFLLYINDMVECCNANLVHYADDTTYYMTGSSLDILIETINSDLENVDTWLRANMLSLNIDKTKAIVISKRLRSYVDVDAIRIRGRDIEYTECINFLGVHIDRDLSFRLHRSKVVSKLSSSLGIMRRLSAIVAPRAMVKLYFALFYSHLTYALNAWGNVSKVTTDKISSLQRHVVELLGDQYSNVGDILQNYSLLRYSHVIKYFCLVNLFRILNGTNSYFLQKIIDIQPCHSYNSRGVECELLNNVYCRTSTSQHNFIYHAIRYWNDLPLDIRKLSDLVVFKRTLKRYLLKDQIDI